MTEPLRVIYERFDPEGEPRDPAWRAERARSPATDILRRLELGLGGRESKFILVGTVGSGKSTELARLADERGRRAFVVRLDLVQHFDGVVNDPAALQRIKSWEVVFLVALAVLRAARERLSFEFVMDAVPNLQRAWNAAAGRSEVSDAAEATVDVWKLAQSMMLAASNVGGPVVAGAVGAGMVALNAVTDVKWKLPIGQARRSLEDQDDAVQSVLAATNGILGDLRHRMGQPVLVVLDGLDRVEAPEAIGALFVESAVLGHLACDLVVCGPFALRHANRLNAVRGLDPKVLYNAPVIDVSDPSKTNPEGLSFLRELVRKRTADLPAGLFADGVAADLALASGGCARDFVKLVRESAVQALLARSPRVETSHRDTAIREQRLLLETGLNAGSIDVLRRVMEHPYQLPDDRHVPELLHYRKLLPYPDGSEWFYPHQLLLRGELLTRA